MNEEQKQKFKQLSVDLPYFAKNCLKVKSKNASIDDFNLNKTQVYVHNFIEKAKSIGKKKIVIIKARQFGISTYTEARFFHKTMFNEATNSFIMADSTSSANNIFEMTKRFYDNLPKGMPKPRLKKSNEKAIVFDDIDSSFRIGTAGNENIGRSMTINNLHCSEVAFWKNADEIVAGLFQTVPTNGEIILESTANGVGNYFHDICIAGQEKDSDFITCFLPWFWNNEYSLSIDSEFKLSDEEKEIKSIYNLTNEQINWRRIKLNTDFKGREYLFRQEYPSNFNEAFISIQNALIPTEFIEKARKGKQIPSDVFPIIFGVDPARNGDRTVISIRQGRRIHKVLIYENMTETELAGELIVLFHQWNPKKCFIDVAHGYGTIDILHEKGLSSIVEGIPFNSKPQNQAVYSNKRTEIFGKLRDWILEDCQIPNNDVITTELGCIPDFKLNSNGQYVMLPKDDIKKLLNGKSTDIADSLALTFASDVAILEDQYNFNPIRVINKRTKL